MFNFVPNSHTITPFKSIISHFGKQIKAKPCISSNDASPCGDMMHLLCKYDVAPFGRNDAMFAPMWRSHASLGEAVIIGEAQHHLP